MAETKGVENSVLGGDFQPNWEITRSRMQTVFLAVNRVSFRLNDSAPTVCTKASSIAIPVIATIDFGKQELGSANSGGLVFCPRSHPLSAASVWTQVTLRRQARNLTHSWCNCGPREYSQKAVLNGVIHKTCMVSSRNLWGSRLTIRSQGAIIDAERTQNSL